MSKNPDKNEINGRSPYHMHHVSRVREISTIPDKDIFLPFSVNAELRDRIVSGLIYDLNLYLNDLDLSGKVDRWDMEEFFESLTANPAFAEFGTLMPSALISTFAITRALDPSRIIESGVWRGSSLHCLRHAAPSADIYAFDTSFQKLAWRDNDIIYTEDDWNNHDVRATSERDICLFDDHIDNARRIEEAAERDFKHLIFDDSVDLGGIIHFRYPGVPTVPMVMNDSLCDGDTIQWKFNETALEYTFREEHVTKARNLIDFARPFPNLTKWIGYLGNASTYYVRLK